MVDDHVEGSNFFGVVLHFQVYLVKSIDTKLFIVVRLLYPLLRHICHQFCPGHFGLNKPLLELLRDLYDPHRVFNQFIRFNSDLLHLFNHFNNLESATLFFSLADC